MSEEQTPVEPVPPASRLGEILGWSLVALAVACFIAFIVAAKQADAWSQAIGQAQRAFDNALLAHTGQTEAAYEAVVTANAAYREAKYLTYLWVSASIAFLQLIPGLLYAVKPSLLGGPWGRLLRLARRSSTKLAQRQPRRHPVTFYQGIGLAFISIGPISINLLPAVGTFFRVPTWLFFGLMLVAVLLLFLSICVGYPLFGEARWWLQSSKRATHEQERPQA